MFDEGICLRSTGTVPLDRLENSRFIEPRQSRAIQRNRPRGSPEMERLAGRREYPISVISADLDELKQVNDTMGHASLEETYKIADDLMFRERLARRKANHAQNEPL